MTVAGPLDLIDDGNNSDEEDIRLPGVIKGE